MKESRRTRYKHGVINMPLLTADQALAVVEILDRAISAIWRAHGKEMEELQELDCVDPAATPPADFPFDSDDDIF